MKNFLARITQLSVSYLVVLLLLVLTAGDASAQAGTWIGGDGNWSDTGNWFDADVPNTATESASITNGSAVSLNSNFTIEGLTLGSLDSLTFLNSFDLTLNDNVTNDGVLTLNGVSSATELRTNANVTFAGSGEVVIGNSSGNPSVNLIGANSSTADPTLTNSAGHTIRALGAGRLGRTRTAVVNEGLIVAEGADANLILDAESATGGLTNTGVVRATNGGQIQIQSLVTNTGALIESNSGGLIALGAGADIIGGEITGDVAANINNGGSAISNLTTSANISLGNSGDLIASGTITNNGTITMNGVNSATELRTNANVTFAGSGEVVIGNSSGNPSVNVIGASLSGADPTLTNSAGHTIRALGAGRLGRLQTAVVNDGLIVAEGADANLILDAESATGGLTNTGVVQATNGGQIQTQSLVTNTGVVRAATGGLVQIADGFINENGTIEAIGAGSIVHTTGSNFVSGRLNQPGDTLRATDGGRLDIIDSPTFDSDTGSNPGILEFVGLNSDTDIFNDDIVPPMGSDPGDMVGPIAGISSPGDLRSISFSSNSGTFRIGGGLNFTARGNTGDFTNTGTIIAGEGSVFAAAGYTGGFITDGGGGVGIFILDSLNAFVSTGTLAGSGEIHNSNSANTGNTIVNRGDILSSDGFISPGDNPGETGTLTLLALEILLGDSNVIEIELGDGEHDALDLITDADPVALNGELELSLLPDFSFTPGEVLNIITATNGLTGTFDTETLPTLAGGFEWMLNYEPNAVTLEIILPGDFDVDGDVDGADFLLWQRGGSPDPTSAADLAAWQGNYGIGSGAGTLSAIEVPEPTSLVLIGMCALMLVSRHRLA